jgi:hypothetical protein
MLVLIRCKMTNRRVKELLSLTEVSHAVRCKAPLEMNGGPKTGIRVQTVSKAELR